MGNASELSYASVRALLELARVKLRTSENCADSDLQELTLSWLVLFGIRELRLWNKLDIEFLEFIHMSIPQSLDDADPVSRLMIFSWEAYFGSSSHKNLHLVSFRREMFRWFSETGRNYYDLEPFFADSPERYVVDREQRYFCSTVDNAPGVNLVGFAQASGGLGEDLRAIARCLYDNNIPFTIFSLPHKGDCKEHSSYSLASCVPGFRYPITVFCLNAIETLRFWHVYGDQAFSNTYTIALLPWELSAFPEELKKVLGLIDEIWAISRFNQDIYKKAGHGNVLHMRPLLEDASGPIVGNRKIPRPFRYLNVFDAQSYLSRKNTRAIVSAFQFAFPPQEGAQVELQLKISNANWCDEQLMAILNICRSDRRISLIDESLSSQHLAHLYSNCDCYVSLHRGEGFGRTIAEAMLHRKPVISTDWSGSKDLVSVSTGFPVNFKLVEVKKGDYPFPEGQLWADPDVEHAAAMMLKVFKIPEPERHSLGILARQFVLNNHSGESVQEVYVNRVKKIFKKLQP